MEARKAALTEHHMQPSPREEIVQASTLACAQDLPSEGQTKACVDPTELRGLRPGGSDKELVLVLFCFLGKVSVECQGRDHLRCRIEEKAFL